MKTTASSSSSSSSTPALFSTTSKLCTPYLLLLLPLALLAAVILIPTLGSSSHGLAVLCRSVPSGAEKTVASSGLTPPEFRLLVGVLTTAKRYERRDIVRLAYALQPAAPAYARVDVRFVLCGVGADPADAALETILHGDVLLLNCTENMNHGKKHDFFSDVPRLFSDEPYDYVMKTDDDTYLRVSAMAEELRRRPRDDVYLGYGFAVGDDPAQFMHGMGYVVYWDIAAWLSTDDDIRRRNDTHGPGDLLFGKWLNVAGKGKHRYDLKPRMYDLNWDMDNFRPDTVGVHMIKDNRRWAAAFTYFNVTAAPPLTNLHHHLP